MPEGTYHNTNYNYRELESTYKYLKKCFQMVALRRSIIPAAVDTYV
jgi:hypothetical protein